MIHRTHALATLAAAALFACTQAGTDAPGGHVGVEVAPLSLAGLSDVAYTLSVKNGSGETVWTRSVRSTAYGDGAGSLSYVGPCDADDNPNTVELVIDALEAGGQPLTVGVDWMNPAPTGDPVTQTATCAADTDVAVTFDLTVARAAQQGFFDISVNFSDVFCSAKLDCKKDVGGSLEDLALLFNPLTGARERTAVLGFACTAGPGQATALHMSEVTLSCATGASATVDVAAGPGNLDPTFPGPAPNTTELLFQAAVFRGVELLGTNNKAYWNVALGLNADAFGATLESDCRVTATATVSDGTLEGGVTPVGTRWPYVDWDVPLYDAGGAFVCGQHELGGGDGVSILYSATAGIAFASTFDSATLGVTRNQAMASCLDYLAAGETVNGIYEIDPDGFGGADPYDVYCDFGTVDGGWTLVMTSSDDAVTTWTWDSRLLLTTDTTLVGDLAQIDHDFKSMAYHDVPFTDVLFVHQPSGITAAYDDVSAGLVDFGSFIAIYPMPTCGWTGGSGFPLTGGTLTVSGALCDTDLYISVADYDGTTCTTSWTTAGRNHSIGPVWSTHNNSACPFDDPAEAGLGPVNQCSNCPVGYSASERPARGFGGPKSLNTGTAGAAQNYIQVYVR
ncbi:MAG: hypothetical protein EP329_11825 [Deltaproteobacteria bacterium]|nr:MAG: hypothetical protein EP329_11825 [Deltaproteobacteria bacterium]